MTDQPLRIATRQSRLALWQAEHVAAALREKHPGLDVVLVGMTTQGDRVLDRPLAEVGGKEAIMQRGTFRYSPPPGVKPSYY